MPRFRSNFSASERYSILLMWEPDNRLLDETGTALENFDTAPLEVLAAQAATSGYDFFSIAHGSDESGYHEYRVWAEDLDPTVFQPVGYAFVAAADHIDSELTLEQDLDRYTNDLNETLRNGTTNDLTIGGNFPTFPGLLQEM